MLVMKGFAPKLTVEKDADTTNVITPYLFKCLSISLIFFGKK
jgi:hypothetical protein